MKVPAYVHPVEQVAVNMRSSSSTTGLDHYHLESQVTPDVALARLGLVLAAPDRPVQPVGDGLFAAVHEVEQTPDFREGECDEAVLNSG